MHGYAISLTAPKRRSARERATISLTLGFGHTRGAAPSVSMGPGAMQLTLMPFAPTRRREKPSGLSRRPWTHRRGASAAIHELRRLKKYLQSILPTSAP